MTHAGKRAATAPKDLQNTQGHASLKFQVNSSIPMEAAGQIPDGRFCLSRGVSAGSKLCMSFARH